MKKINIVSVLSIALSIGMSCGIWYTYVSLGFGLSKFNDMQVIFDYEIIVGSEGVKNPRMTLDIIWKGNPLEHMNWAIKRCYSVERQSAFQLKGNFYTTMYDILRIHERWLKSEKRLQILVLSMYSPIDQPCICTIRDGDNFIHLINPNITSYDRGMNEIEEKISSNGLSFFVTRNIPMKLEFTYDDWKTWKKEKMTIEGSEVYDSFTCLLHLGLVNKGKELDVFSVKKIQNII